MKKISLIALFAALVMSVNATDIWTGDQHVSWSGGVQIQAAQFADAVAGQKIVVSFNEASDGIEFKVMNQFFDHLAGSREAAWISGDGAFEQFLTQTAVDSLKAYGLEIIGANFNCTNVALEDGKAELKDGYTVWTGYFWADDWNTLELYAESYNGIDFSKVESIRFYSEAAGTDYVLNFRSSWEDDGFIADATMMTNGEGYKQLTLTEELRTKMVNASRWMIQYNKEALSPFNVTDVVLVMTAEPETHYYLAGSMNGWQADAGYMLEANPETEGEYMLSLTLAEGDQFKVIGVEGETTTWYPDGMDNNYVVDADHAGEATVYFRPDGQGGEGWHYGYYYVQVIPRVLENVVLGALLPENGKPENGVNLVGTFSDEPMATEVIEETGGYIAIFEADGRDTFTFVDADDEDNYLVMRNAAGEWVPAVFTFEEEWEDDTWKGDPVKMIDMDLTDNSKYAWSTDIPEGLENVTTDKAQSTKVMINGMLYIVRDGKMYNVLGTEMK